MPARGPSPHPLVYALLACVALWIFLRWFERVNLYVPDRTITMHPGTYGLRYEELRLKAADGPIIHGWFIARAPADPVILFCHGNAGNISYRLEKTLLMRQAGATVLLFDYRGYGQSSGAPSEAGTYRDAEAVFKYLTETRGVSANRIVLYGESLGCGVATELALRHPGTAGLILESGFTSTMDMAREIFPWLPARLMVRFRYDNLAKVPRLACPLLVMHSRDDDAVPFRMGRALYEAATTGRKTFFEMRGSHNDGFRETGKGYGAAIAEFLHAALGAKGP